MKPYKPFLFALIIIVLAISLSGCIAIIPLAKHYDIPADEVVSVQLYDLRHQDHERGFDTILEPVYTIPEEDKEDLP